MKYEIEINSKTAPEWDYEKYVVFAIASRLYSRMIHAPSGPAEAFSARVHIVSFPECPSVRRGFPDIDPIPVFHAHLTDTITN